MKNITEFMFLTVLIVIFTVFRLNYVTADLIPVEEDCQLQIEILFENSDKNSLTVKEQIEYIFLNVVTDNLNSPEKRIVREYTKHLYKAVERTFIPNTAAAFCQTLGNEENHCLQYLEEYVGNLYTMTDRTMLVEEIYFHYAVRENTADNYLDKFITFVQKTYAVNRHILYGVTTPKLFCEMRECYYQIGCDIKDITESDLKDSGFIKFAMRHADYRGFHYENSKNYMDYIFNQISMARSIPNMRTPKEFCKTYHRSHRKLCYVTIKRHNWNNDMTKEDYLKYIFYYLNENNTTSVQVDGNTINFTHHYITATSRMILYNDIRSSPTDYCSDVVVVH